MKVAVFYTKSHTAAWSLTLGLTDTVARMGHEVLAGPIDPGSKTLSRSAVPSFEELQSCDAILVSGPEYLAPFLKALYPDWAKLKVPKGGWYHESNHREDREFHYERYVSSYDVNFFPAPQDAEELKGEFLPFGVDTDVFRADNPVPRDIEFAFIGLMYDKRVKFYQSLPEDIRSRLKIGNVLVQDLDGINIRKSAELYAETLRRIRVFVMMPALSQLVVTKEYEIKACGAFLLTPGTDVPENYAVIAADECKFAHEKDRLDQRVEVILAKLRG